MKSPILLITLIILFCCGNAHAHHLLIVQSSRVKPYEEALKGVTRACGEEYVRIVVSEMKKNHLRDYLREERPRAIIAIGADALEKVRNIRDIPVVYLMVLNPGAIVPDGARNVTGVRMKQSPDDLLDLILRALPHLRRIGLLHDPIHLGTFVKRAVEVARSRNVILVPREVRTPREVPEALQQIAGTIDAFWMLPDTAVVTPETSSYIILFAGEHRLPVITFSSKYMNMGALLALDLDPQDMGTQAGEMAARVLNGANVQSLPPRDARKISVHVNHTMIRRLGLDDGFISRIESAERSEP